MIPPVGAIAVVAPVYTGIGILQVFTTLFLFFCIPVALFGMILRLLGFTKEGEGEGEGWRWNVVQAIARFFNYLVYHTVMFGGWFFFLILTGVSYMRAGNLFIDRHLVFFSVYVVVCALVGPYVVYLLRKRGNIETIRPGVWLYVRLLLWNIFIFSMMQYFLSFLTQYSIFGAF